MIDKKPKNPKFVNRPFPRTCYTCGEKRVELETIDYNAIVKRDGETWHFIAYNLEIPICQACGEKFFDIKADEQITKELDEHIRCIGLNDDETDY